MSAQTPVRRLADQTMDVVDGVIRSFEGPFDDCVPFMIAMRGDGSKPRVLDLPNELLSGEAAGKAEVAHRLVLPVITETGAKLIAWVATVFTLDLEGKSNEEANEAIGRVTMSGIANHPDRRELLIVNAMDATAVETWVTRVMRTAIAPPTLGPWEDFGVAARSLLGLEAQSFYGETTLLNPLQAALRDSPERPVQPAGDPWNKRGPVRVDPDADGFVVTVRGGDSQVKWLARGREYPTLEAARRNHEAIRPLIHAGQDIGAWRGLPGDSNAPVVVLVGSRRFVDRALQMIDDGEPYALDEDEVRMFVGRRLQRMANTPPGDTMRYFSS